MHVLVGLVLVVAGLVLLLPSPVHPSDVVLVLFGLGSIACGLAEHADYMKRHDLRAERAR